MKSQHKEDCTLVETVNRLESYVKFFAPKGSDESSMNLRPRFDVEGECRCTRLKFRSEQLARNWTKESTIKSGAQDLRPFSDDYYLR